MKKYSFIPVILILALILCSCGVENMRLYDDNAGYAQDIVSRFVSALKERDNDMLRSLFSNKVNSEVSELYVQTTELFEFIQGEIISHEVSVSIASGGEISYGKRIVDLGVPVTIETDTAKYYLYVFVIRQDDFDRNNEGIKSISIIEESNWDCEYLYRDNGEHGPGITMIREKVSPLSQSEQDIDPQVADMVDHYKNQDR